MKVAVVVVRRWLVNRAEHLMAPGLVAAAAPLAVGTLVLVRAVAVALAEWVARPAAAGLALAMLWSATWVA